jgi:hypothetical protein
MKFAVILVLALLGAMMINAAPDEKDCEGRSIYP